MGKRVKDPGIGTFSQVKAQRFINTSGTFNVKHINKKNSINEAYIFLIKISWTRFFLILSLFFVALNSLFGLIYQILGVAHIGISKVSLWEDFLNAVFFSVQTLTTVGYGFFAPTTLLTGIVSSIESLLGLVSFAFVTGLIYGRFSKPHANIRFSKHILLCKHEGKDALMFRVVSSRNGMAILPKVRLSLMLPQLDDKGVLKNQFFDLELERRSITYLPTTWTLVHAIDQNSPFWSYTRDEIARLKGEFLILFSYQDEYFNDELHQAFSYIFEDLKVGYRFKKAFYFDDKGQTIINHDKFDDLQPEYS